MSHAAVESVPDAGLAARAASGDVDAYELLVRQHHASCLRFARRMLVDDADAEDAVQDAFMRAFLAISRFDARQPFRGWLFRILVNRCRTLGLRDNERTTHGFGYREHRRRLAAPERAPGHAAQRSGVQRHRALDVIPFPTQENAGKPVTPLSSGDSPVAISGSFDALRR